MYVTIKRLQAFQNGGPVFLLPFPLKEATKINNN